MSWWFKLYLTTQGLIAIYILYILAYGSYSILHDLRNTRMGIGCFEAVVPHAAFVSSRLETKSWYEAKERFIGLLSEPDREALKDSLQQNCPSVFNLNSAQIEFNNISSRPFDFSEEFEILFGKVEILLGIMAALYLFNALFRRIFTSV